MDADKRQQALDNFRNALGRLEQSDFRLSMLQKDSGFVVEVWDVYSDMSIRDITTSISNHTLKIKRED